MNRFGLTSRITFAGGLVFAVAVAAGEPAGKVASPPSSASTSAGMPAFVQDIGPGAAEPVEVVDQFSAAIRAAKLDQAARLLDEKVLVLESGGSERSRDEYLGEHAIADAAFMQNAKQQPRFRRARVEGAMAWVGTESIVTHDSDGKKELVRSTESMVLRKAADGWKIVHIHWSSRRTKAN